jgi:DNA-binding LacI/PurR family transcriptional regulator
MGTAIVALDRRIQGIPTDSVIVDNEGAAHEAVTHLVRLGHRRIAIVGGPHDAHTARERLRGYERAHTEARLAIDPALVTEGTFREMDGFRLTRGLLALPDPPTAIFSVNNLTTIGVLRALRDAEWSVPDRMSLVGFDDFPTAELLAPPLTVVRQPTYRMGAQAVELLIRRIQEPTAPVQEVLLVGSLVIRGSTGPYLPVEPTPATRGTIA